MQAKLKYGLGSFKKLAGIVSSVSLEVNDVHYPLEGYASSKQYLKMEELQSIYDDEAQALILTCDSRHGSRVIKLNQSKSTDDSMQTWR